MHLLENTRAHALTALVAPVVVAHETALPAATRWPHTDHVCRTPVDALLDAADGSVEQVTTNGYWKHGVVTLNIQAMPR